MADNKYLVQPKFVDDRRADYETGKYLQDAFECLKTSNHSFNGNISYNIGVHKETMKIKFFSRMVYGNQDYVSLHQAIPASLALYRTICMFPNPRVFTEGSEGYKVTWGIILKHRKTGALLEIREWKGAFGIGTTYTNINDLPEEFKKDMEIFLNLLLSDKSPHPYDGLVAGSVA